MGRRPDAESRDSEDHEQSVQDRKELKSKDYDRELKKLHVKLQKWVKHKGLNICILFEGRDGAGKGARSRRSPSALVRASLG